MNWLVAEGCMHAGTDRLDDSVRLGETYTYTWDVRERSALGPSDPSSVSWLFESKRGSLFAGPEKLDDSVRLGETYTYTWDVRERSGPGPSDPSSVVWIYHSHHSEVQDTVTGLYGAMIVSGQVRQESQLRALWDVRDRSGPDLTDPSSVMWIYRLHRSAHEHKSLFALGNTSSF